MNGSAGVLRRQAPVITTGAGVAASYPSVGCGRSATESALAEPRELGLAGDRRWRWLLVAGGLPAMASLWALGLGSVTVGVIWARWAVGGPREASGIVGLTVGLGGFGATLAALRVFACHRPWLFLGWQCTFHCGRSRWSAGGLAAAAYAAAGVALPGDPVGQYLASTGSVVADGKLELGDLVFWAVVPGTPASVCHVAIYVGAGQVLDASPGCGQVLVQRCERVRPLAPDDWWRDGDVRAVAAVYRATRPVGPAAGVER